MSGSRPHTGGSHRPIPVFTIVAPDVAYPPDTQTIKISPRQPRKTTSASSKKSQNSQSTYHAMNILEQLMTLPEKATETTRPKSGAIHKIKANGLARDQKAQKYAKQFTTSPYAPLSASVSKHTTGVASQVMRPQSGKSTRSHPESSTSSPTSSPKMERANTPVLSLTPMGVSGATQVDPTHPHHFESPKNHPTGAQYAGFYSRIRSAQAHREAAMPVSVGNLIKEANPQRPKSAAATMTMNSTASLPFSNTQSSSSRSLNQSTNLLNSSLSLGSARRRLSRGNSFRKSIIPTLVVDPPDMYLIESGLAILTDSDGSTERLAEAASNLAKMLSEVTEPPMTKAMHDSGAIPILLKLIPNVLGFPDIIANICILVNSIASEQPNAMLCVQKLDGLQILIKAGSIAAKSSLETKTKLTEINTSNNFNNSNGMTLQITADPDTSPELFVSALSSPAGSRRGSVISGGSRRASLAAGSRRTSISSRRPSMSIPPLFSFQESDEKVGFLAKYSNPKFIDDLEKMDHVRRAESIKHLVSVFKKMDSVLGMTNSLSMELDIDASTQTLVAEGLRMLEAESVSMFLVSRENGDLISYNPSTKLTDIEGDSGFSARFPATMGIIGEAATSGELLNIRDALSHPAYNEDIDGKNVEQEVQAILAAPIVTAGEDVVGVIVARNKTSSASKKYYDEEDEYVFKTLASTLGTIIGNAKMYDSMQHTQKKVQVLLETTKSLGSILDINVLTQKIMDSAKELLAADRCTIFLDDAPKKQLVAKLPGRDGAIQEIRIPYAGIAGAVFTSGKPINIPEAYKDSRFNPEVDKRTGYVTRNILCMPIKNIHGECLGCAQMINKKAGVFSSEDEMMLSSFSAQAAVAIEKSHLFKKTEDMRIYLQSILRSITSCVITLSESLCLETINRDWFAEVVGVSEETMRDSAINKWLSEENATLLADIKEVCAKGQPIFSTEYELKGVKNVIVNYQVMPLLGAKGVVLVLDDISVEKRAVMTLGRYMSPELAKQVMEDNGQLGGKRKEVSILFSDIRSFTTLSEGMEPWDVVELLNHHFTDAVNAITDEHGILDKFIGDAVMAVFGVPFAGADDAMNACNSALRMKELLAISNKERSAAGKKTIKIGIGVNTGMVLSGNIGSVKRMEFSCIGDAVNLASRVEGLTKFYGVMIMITEFTLSNTNDAFLTREIEPTVVTGKKNAVKMYELLGRKGDVLPIEVEECHHLYASGYSLYRERQFEKALSVFQQAIELSQDGPSKVLAARCKHYMSEPPPPSWTGVYVAEGK